MVMKKKWILRKRKKKIKDMVMGRGSENIKKTIKENKENGYEKREKNI